MDGLFSSDVALLTRDNDFTSGGSAFFWIFALLVLAGGNGFGFNNNPGYATQATGA